MLQDEREIGGVPSLDYDSALCEEQALLLNKINILLRDAAIHDPSEHKHIYALKQEYNHLVKKRAKLARSPLSDPTEVLPSELWPDIIRNIVGDPLYGPRCHMNELLDLISVSKGWCSLLTTLPVIWTRIWLDQREPDYLAKAMMCIQLSGECKIDLFIQHLTVEEWRGICSMIVPEGRRIRRLSIVVRDSDFMVARQVLGEFTKLPVLEELFLPSMTRLPNTGSELSDQQYIHALLTEKMPSIRMVDIPEYSMHDELWNPYLTNCSLRGESLTKEAVETLMLLPHLHYLTFMETAQTLEHIPGLLKSSFGSVLSFTYGGADICRRLTWIGENLSTLSTRYPENGDGNALLVALFRFPRLHELAITIMSSFWGQKLQNNSRTANPHNSIRVLKLRFFALNATGADCDSLFSMLFPASPFLEDLSVLHGGIITDTGWNSIRSIANLRDLYIGLSSIDDSSSIPLNMKSLRQFRLALNPHELGQSLPRVESTFLQNLQLKRMPTQPHTITTTLYIVAGVAFPNITSLTIADEGSATWELRALSKLRELEIQATSQIDHMAYWVSDVLESILLRPRDSPALEKITFTCDFIEWDVLLLMLERRNFLNEPGISSIRTLVFRHDLPYRLLYPLSELLGGRFVERDSNQSFSLEAIGERMFNESLTGCMQCHYSFRECDSLVLSLRGIYGIRPKETTECGKEYHLPHDYRGADPPLTLDITLWLSGRHERRDAWKEKYKEPIGYLRRKLECDRAVQSGPCTVTADILVGAHFVHD